MGDTAEGIVFDFHAHKACLLAGVPEPSGYRLGESQKHFFGIFPGGGICCQRGGVADAFFLGWRGLYPGIIQAVGIVPEGGAVEFQVGLQDPRICLGQVANGGDSKLAQGLPAGVPAQEQPRHGKWPELLPDLPGIQGVYQVRFLEIGSHLGQYFPVGDAYIDSESEGVEDRVLDDGCRCLRRGIICRNRGIIHIAFINADLFDIGTDAGEIFHEPRTLTVVKGMVWRDDG